MTKYCANIVTDASEYTIALFSDDVTIKAMAAFAEEQLQFERGNSLLTPCNRTCINCKKIYIEDLTTGEVLYECVPPKDPEEVLEGQISLDDFILVNNK